MIDPSKLREITQFVRGYSEQILHFPFNPQIHLIEPTEAKWGFKDQLSTIIGYVWYFHDDVIVLFSSNSFQIVVFWTFFKFEKIHLMAVYTILISISKLPHSQSLWRNQMQIADEAKSNIVHQFCSPMWRFPANILKDNTVKYLVRIISGLAFLRASRTFIILVN